VPLHDAGPHTLAQLQGGAHWVSPNLTAQHAGEGAQAAAGANKVTGRLTGQGHGTEPVHTLHLRPCRAGKS
jgi:hypothetical protein